MISGQDKQVLNAMDPAEVKKPNAPVEVLLQEATELLHFASQPAIKEALLSVGQPPFEEELEARIITLRQAECEWADVRVRNKRAALVESEQRAMHLRRACLAAGRWNLRGDREGLAVLNVIGEATGVAGLIQDCFELAQLFERRAGAFANDRSFDVKERIAALREAGEALSADSADYSMDPFPACSRDLRDRAATRLNDLVSEVRAAGRYAFRDHRREHRRFTSEYRRRARRRSAANKSPVDEASAALAAG